MYVSASDKTQYTIENLIPGEDYYVRVSAANDLGYGPRRVTAPMSLTVPVTQPSVPVQYEGAWGAPQLYVQTATSLLVKIGAPLFDGGSLVTTFNVQWDKVSTFDSGVSGDALGSASVNAFETLCTGCVFAIKFDYNDTDAEVKVEYYSDDDTMRRLKAGTPLLFQLLMMVFHIPL